MFTSTVKLCETADGYIEVVEGKTNRFTCSGLQDEDTMIWALADSNSEQWIGTCPPLNANGTLSACTIGSLPMFSIIRISGNESVITIDTTKVSDASLFQTKKLICSVQMGSKEERVTCQLDYVYPAESISCRAQFSGNVWLMTGDCTISKIYSTSNRYGCWLYQRKTGTSEPTFLGSYAMETRNIVGTNYHSGNCSFETVLPSEGRYSYSVIIIPGGANVSASLIGTDIIYRPSVSPSHNCPSYIQEGNSLDCTCFAKDTGSPPGKIQWDNTGSARLTRAFVTSGDYGTRFTCYIMWNNTATKSVTHTLFVKYEPTFVDLKINSQSGNTTVNERETVNITCQANGQPMPTLRLDMDTGREIKVVLGGSLSNTNERSLLTHILHGVRVQDTGKYSCIVNNGIGGDAFSSISLYVKGPLSALRESFSSERDSYPFINYRGSPETLRFDVLTYEVPNQYLFVLLGVDPKVDAGLPPRRGVLKSECVAGDVLQTTKCSITANNVTEYDVGFYNLTLENSMGSLRVTFNLLRYAAQDTESQSKLHLGLGIGFGTGALAIVFLAIVFVYKWRRQKGAKDERPSMSKPDHSDEDVNDRTINFAESENAYDAIGLNETAMRSSYMELHGYTNLKEDRRKSHGYEVPVTSIMTTGI